MIIHVHHHIPGRSRFRLSPWPSDAVLLRIRNCLGSIDGVTEFANPHSGSLLVTHPNALSAAQILELVKEAAEGTEEDGRLDHSIPQRTRTSLASEDDEIGQATMASVAELLGRLQASLAGLTSSDARQRLSVHGKNIVPAASGRSRGEMAAAQFTTFPVALLFGSAILSLATGGLLDAAVTIGVVLANAAIGYSSEDATEKLIRRLSQPVVHRVEILRDGEPATLPASEIVPGDVLLLSPGSLVAADARVTSAHELSVDESLLTGESMPVQKIAEVLDEIPMAVADRRNMLHAGTVVTGGGGRAVVIRTGGRTEMARTRAMIGSARPPRPEIEEQLAGLGGRLAAACLGASTLVFTIGLLRGEPLLAITRGAIALAVAAIPEGLPAIATSTLALEAKAMEREKAYVRALPAIEALGTIDTICLDKTGTLTENRMGVTAAFVGGRSIDLSPGSVLQESDRALLRSLAEAAVLCSDASLAAGTGSATELALLRFARAVGLDPDGLQSSSPRAVTHNRNPRRRWMATEHRNGETNLIAVKGAPDELLAMAAHDWADGAIQLLDDNRRDQIMAANDAMAAKGLRVLGVARYEGEYVSGRLRDLIWLGLVALADPIRAEAREAIETFHRAGIRTIMLTGDQSATALAVAEALSLSRTGTISVVETTGFAELDDRQIGKLALKTSVFARVSPADKLRIVRGLQIMDKRVAMIGDGVNDGPALRAAAVGVAMGQQSTDVAREVADIVIAGDDLRALARAIARGRATNDNIRTAIGYLLSTNLSEILLMLGESLHGRGELETPMELFWLNLVTDILPALGLAFAEPQGDVMVRPPRAADMPLFESDEIAAMAMDGGGIAAAALAVHFLKEVRSGAGRSARTATFLALALAQIAQGWALRDRSPRASGLSRDSDRRLAAALTSSGGLLALPFLLSPLRQLLGIGVPTAADLLISSVFAAGSFGFAEGRRTVRGSASAAAPSPALPPARTASAPARRPVRVQAGAAPSPRGAKN